MNQQQKDVPIPERMSRLPLDHRGYPIPVIVQRSATGEPLFTVNDNVAHDKCTKYKLCPICGDPLGKELWFAGGPLSAFHPGGSYYDSPMHHECVSYAMQVCPYLALPGYVSNLAQVIPHLEKKVPGAIMVDPTQRAERPPLFVVVLAYGRSLLPQGSLVNLIHQRPLRPYHAVEFWRYGSQLPFEDGVAEVLALKDLKGHGVHVGFVLPRK